MQAFGYDGADGISLELTISSPKVLYGEALCFEIQCSGGGNKQRVMIDYAIHFVKANGKRTPKVFKWKDTQLNATGGLVASRKHAIKPITTRTYYGGEHLLEIIVNGVSLGMQPFILQM